MADLLALLWIPFLMCLVLTGIHAYLGVHVLAREVVFVDIALAQIAALGATAAFIVDYDMDTWESYAIALFATLVGALVLSLTRTRRRNVSQEAVIGVVYAVSSAGAVLLVFSYLIVPALAATVIGGTVAKRLLIGWSFGTLVSVIGMATSASFDLPTGAAVVCTFGLTLLASAVAGRLFCWRPVAARAVLPTRPLTRWKNTR